MKKVWILLILSLILLSSCNVLKLVTGKQASISDGFFGNSSNETSYGSGVIIMSVNEARRDFYTTTDKGFRTLGISDQLQALECSSDGGNSWSDCTGITSYTWEVENYTSNHLFKTTHNGSVHIESFVPSDNYPGITFGTCTHTLSSSGNFTETFGSITHLIVAGDVICINDGVTITMVSGDHPISFNVDNVKLVANTDSRVIITNSSVSSALLEHDQIGNQLSIGIYGIEFLQEVEGSVALNFSGGSASIWESVVSLSHENNTGNTVQFLEGNYSLNYSVVSSARTVASTSAVELSNSNLDLNKSILEGVERAISITNTTTNKLLLDSNESLLSGLNETYTGAGSGVVSTFIFNGELEMNFSESVIASQGGPAIYIHNSNGSQSISFFKSLIGRDINTNMDSVAILNEETTGDISIEADETSLFCNKSDQAGAKFSAIFNETGNTIFDVTTMQAHTSVADINLCPDTIEL